MPSAPRAGHTGLRSAGRRAGPHGPNEPWPITTLVTSRGVESKHAELVGQRSPMLRAGHPEIFLLLPAGIVQDEFVAALDHADVHREIDGRDVVDWIGALRDEGSVRHEGSKWHLHESAALDQPDRAHVLSLDRETGRGVTARRKVRKSARGAFSTRSLPLPSPFGDKDRSGGPWLFLSDPPWMEEGS